MREVAVIRSDISSIDLDLQKKLANQSASLEALEQHLLHLENNLGSSLKSQHGITLDRISTLESQLGEMELKICNIENLLDSNIVQMLSGMGNVQKDIGRDVAAFNKDIASLHAESKNISQLIRSNYDSTTRDIRAVRNDIQSSRGHLDTQMKEFLDPILYPHVLKEWYAQKTGNILDLDYPRTYNEKIQWMKLYNPDPRKTVLSDKLLVRDWIKEKIGESYLIPLLGVYHHGKDINFDELPDQFVLKANHGSGFNAIIRDKNKEDLEAIRHKADSWPRTNFTFQYGFELQYDKIPRRLVVEQYMENADADMPDYKFWCFDGKVQFIELITGRHNGAHMAILDCSWNLLPFTTGAYPPIEMIPPMPKKIPEMVSIAEFLSSGFSHVRVDLYLLDSGEIKFGEMTFSTSSGVVHWDPPEADLLVGNMFHLPENQ